MVITASIAKTIATPGAAFTQQLAGALKIVLPIIGVNPLDQGRACALLQRPAQQGLEAVTEKRGQQRAFDITLHVNHRRRTGDKVVQPRMGGCNLLLLILDVADIQHKTHDAPPGAGPQHLALNSIPLGRLGALGLMHPRKQQQLLAMLQQFIKTAAELVPICRMKQRQPGISGH